MACLVLWILTLVFCGVVGWSAILYGGVANGRIEAYEYQAGQYITKEELFNFLESIDIAQPNQVDASTLLPPYIRYMRAPKWSAMKADALNELYYEMAKRRRFDNIMYSIVKQLFGSKVSLAELQTSVRPRGQPPVDYIDCVKSLVAIYKRNCGTISIYGMKYLLAIGNMCNAKINGEQFASASSQVCGRSRLASF